MNFVCALVLFAYVTLATFNPTPATTAYRQESRVYSPRQLTALMLLDAGLWVDEMVFTLLYPWDCQWDCDGAIRDAARVAYGVQVLYFRAVARAFVYELTLLRTRGDGA